MMNRVKNSNCCKFCGKSFFLKSCLITHELKHKGEENTEEEYAEDTGNTENKIEVNVEVAVTTEGSVKNLKETQSEGDIKKDGKPYSCHVCGKQYSLKSIFKTHLIGHKAPRQIHVCVQCNTSFIKLNDFKLHMETHEVKQFQCSICLKDFPNLLLYSRHINKGHKTIDKSREKYIIKMDIKRLKDEGSFDDPVVSKKLKSEYLCTICDTKWPTKSVLDKHDEKHREDLTCVMCEKKFDDYRSLQEHVKVHLVVDTQVLCELCGRVVDRKSYAAHLRKHSEDGPYRCSNCSLFFQEAKHLYAHMKIHRNKNLNCKSKTEISCSICHEKCPTTSILEDHLERHKKDLTCVICEKKFSHYRSLQRHARGHSDSIPQVLCEICGKSVHKKTYKAHLRSHEGVKPHECSECSKLFTMKRHLHTHMRNVHSLHKNFRCDICRKGFLTQQTLDKHCQLHTEDDGFECDMCDEKFLTWPLFRQHESQVHPNRLKVCKICNKHFGYSSQLFKHYIQHSEDDLLKLDEKTKKLISKKKLMVVMCEYCGVYVDSCKLKPHMRRHNGEKPHKCKLCDKCFSDKAGLNLHMLTHSEERPFKCEYCNKAFRRADHLRTHVPLHLSERPFKCDICGKSFPLQNYLHNHRKFYHEMVPRRPITKTYTYAKTSVCKGLFECEECGEKVSGWSGYQRHEKEVHPEKRPFCQLCSEEFPDSSRLYVHYANHLEEDLENLDEKTRQMISLKKLILAKCEICNKFVNKTQLKPHMRLHTGEKPYKCKYCEKSFRLGMSLSNHMRIHTGERPFECDQCDKKFNQMPHLRAHLALHTSEKPFVCNICGKAFALQNYLYNHLKIHNKSVDAPTRSKKVYACFHCGKHYTNKSAHMAHQQKCRHESGDSGSDEYSSETEIFETGEACEFVTVSHENIEIHHENIEISNQNIEGSHENITIECTPGIPNEKFQYVIL